MSCSVSYLFIMYMSKCALPSKGGARGSNKPNTFKSRLQFKGTCDNGRIVPKICKHRRLVFICFCDMRGLEHSGLSINIKMTKQYCMESSSLCNNCRVV